MKTVEVPYVVGDMVVTTAYGETDPKIAIVCGVMISEKGAVAYMVKLHPQSDPRRIECAYTPRGWFERRMACLQEEIRRTVCLMSQLDEDMRIKRAEVAK